MSMLTSMKELPFYYWYIWTINAYIRKKKKKSVEKRGRERERPIFLRLHGKPIKPLHRTCTAHEGTGHPLEEVLKAWAGK